MKKIAILSLFLSLFLFSCKQKEVKSPIEGVWKLVYAESPSANFIYPENVKGEDIKVWTKTYFTFDGTFKNDTTEIDSYGWGTYTLNGNKYVETLRFYPDKSSIGNVINMLLEIKNDTLIQKFPADENFQLKENYNTEKYVRLE